MNFKIILVFGSFNGVGNSGVSDVGVALVGKDTIVIVDMDKSKVRKSVKVTGIDGVLVGIDVRVVDGMLYGLIKGGKLYNIEIDGKEKMKEKDLDKMLRDGMVVKVDFNIEVDRLSVIGSNSKRFSVKVEEGKESKDGS